MRNIHNIWNEGLLDVCYDLFVIIGISVIVAVLRKHLRMGRGHGASNQLKHQYCF